MISGKTLYAKQSACSELDSFYINSQKRVLCTGKGQKLMEIIGEIPWWSVKVKAGQEKQDPQ